MVIGVTIGSAGESNQRIFAHILESGVYKTRGVCFRIVLPPGVARTLPERRRAGGCLPVRVSWWACLPGRPCLGGGGCPLGVARLDAPAPALGRSLDV